MKFRIKSIWTLFYSWQSNSICSLENTSVNSSWCSFYSIHLERKSIRFRSSKFLNCCSFRTFFFYLKSKLHYEYNTSSTNKQILLPPVLNIVERGIVPREISSRKSRTNWILEIRIEFLAFYIFFPCLLTNRVNSSVLFRFSNSTRNSQSSFINIKFQKSCRNDVINQTFLNQFYNFNQINEYLIAKECRYDFVFKKESK